MTLLGLLAAVLLATPAAAQSGPESYPGVSLPPAIDSSLAILPGGKLSASGLHNVMSYAHGVSIGDGASHTIGNEPVGSWWHGITTLAQIAAKDPSYYWLTDSGALTGPLCTYQSTTNCFTNPAGVYKFTDAMVAGMEIGGLALQAAETTMATYLPAATIRSSFPIMIPIAQTSTVANTPGSMTVGDGPQNSMIVASGSFGTLYDATSTTRNIPLMSCGDPAATPTNTLGRWHNDTGQCTGTVRDIGLWGSQSATSAYGSTYATDGLAIGSRLVVENVTSSFFYNDFTLTGDHTLRRNLYGNDGYRGLYIDAPNSIMVGDLDFDHLMLGKATFAAIAVNGRSSLAGHFASETYLGSGLWDIYGEPNGNAPILEGAHFELLQTEYTGLGLIIDGDVLSGSTYNDAAKVRSVLDWTTEKWFHSFNNSIITPGTPWRRRATVDALNLTGQLHGLVTNGGSIVPSADPGGPAGIAIFNVAQTSDPGDQQGLEIEGSVLQTFANAVGAGVGGATIPVFDSAVVGGDHALPADGATWQQSGGGGGMFAKLDAKGSYVGTHLGDLMEYEPGSFRLAEPAGAQPSQPLMGTAAQAGLTTGLIMPLQTYGTTEVAKGDHVVGGQGFAKKALGVGGYTVIVSGSGGTNGTYTLTATGGPCSTEPVYSVVVASGSVASATVSNADAVTCTGAPALSLSSITGLTRASVTPAWPPANVQAASSKTDGDVVGSSNGVANGQTVYLRLMGLQ